MEVKRYDRLYIVSMQTLNILKAPRMLKVADHDKEAVDELLKNHELQRIAGFQSSTWPSVF